MRVLVHEDSTTPMVAVNLLYDVGARDETPELTGLAHLFEHLMFEGSENIPEFDKPLQLAGGSNNAFTSNDVTNYYEILPADNVETALWLESDRMLSLGFSEEKLTLQKKVVCEEFKQRYLNQPYGDIWLLSRKLAYTTHSYRWPTIGKELSHIENVKLDEVKHFFFSHYAPNNGILVLAGKITPEQGFALAEKWFGSIPKRDVKPRNIPQEPKQTEERRLRVERNVPQDALMLNFHMDARMSSDFYRMDLLSDILSSGKSSRLYEMLVKEKQLFTEIGAYVTGSLDPGQFILFGKLSPGKTMQEGESAIWELLEDVKKQGIETQELEKVKNKMETNERFSLLNVLNKAMKLAFSELMGDANLVNTDLDRFREVEPHHIQEAANRILVRENASILEYYAKTDAA